MFRRRATAEAVLVLTFSTFAFAMDALAQVVIPGPYSYSLASRLAPGQVIPLFLRTNLDLPEAGVADGEPWPNTLGGVSCYLDYSIGTPSLSARKYLAIGAVAQRGGPAMRTYVILAQMPFEIRSSIGTVNPELWLLRIAVNGALVDTHAVSLFPSQVHIRNRCDYSSTPMAWPDSSCPHLISRSDGSLVTGRKPAVPGETLSMLMYGLGHTTPPTETGRPFQAGASLSNPERATRLYWDFTTNAMARRLDEDSAELVQADVVAGPVPISGTVGQYRIDVRVPSRQLRGCDLDRGTRSNATLMVYGDLSVDGAPICIGASE